MKRDGFTLVELLVVIGIIVVLIALLLPAVSVVREDCGHNWLSEANANNPLKAEYAIGLAFTIE